MDSGLQLAEVFAINYFTNNPNADEKIHSQFRMNSDGSEMCEQASQPASWSQSKRSISVRLGSYKLIVGTFKAVHVGKYG